MKNFSRVGITPLLIVLIVAGILAIGAGGYVAIRKAQTPQQQLLGDDRDVHGCIGSAGYSWCEAKQKCLRPFEEKCEATVSVSDINLTYPIGGEILSSDQLVNISYKVSDGFKKKLAPKDLTELYLLDTNNVLAGYIGKADINSDKFVWDPQRLIHNGGLDSTISPTPPGRYSILLLSRHPFCTPEKIECGVDTLDNPYTKFINGTLWNSAGIEPWAPRYETKLLASGVSVSLFSITQAPNSKFSATKCIKDSDCPSSRYVCQETQGSGTACSSADPSCVPTHTVIAGECKLKAGNWCNVDSDCVAGNLCHNNVCVSPIGRQCTGTNDTSCPADFACTRGCGPPVVRISDNTPPSYFCQLKGYNRSCPICLAKNTLIDTPLGEIPVQDLRKGAPVWTVTVSGERVPGVVVEMGKTPVSPDHKMAELVFDDGRMLFVSLGHPTIDGRTVGGLAAGDLYDDARVVASNRVLYGDVATYDILPSGETGFYFANGVLLDSTFRQVEKN